MNLSPPPETEDINELRMWCLRVYEFLLSPAFTQIKFIPKASAETYDQGTIYYDSDDDKLKVCTSSSVPTWADTN